jgi:2-methylisocitrate lyase-like PEP mutase family enzyme
MKDTLDRAKAYMDAGASSIFVPGVLDQATIEELVQGIPGPLNVLVGPGAPSAPELFSWGVRRISVGGSVMQATMGLVRAIATELRQTGTYEKIGQYALTHSQAQQLMTQKK